MPTTANLVVVAHGDNSGDGGHVDDASGFALQHGRDECFAAVEHPADVYGKQAVEVRRGRVWQ
jgi:hypothetical protein